MREQEQIELSEESYYQLLNDVEEDFSLFTQLIQVSGKDLSKSPKAAKRFINQPFVLKQHQKELIDFINKDDSEQVILKARQIGVTEVLVAYCIWRLLFGDNESMLLIIPGRDRVLSVQRKFKSQIRSLEELFPNVLDVVGGGSQTCTVSNNKKTNNRIDIVTSTEKSGRSGTYTLTIIDEFAFIQPSSLQEDVLQAVRPSSSKRVILSTPFREGDKFEELCIQAEASNTLFQRDIHDVKDDWFGTPENAESWISEELFKGKKDSEINREYLCKFRGAIEHQVWRPDARWFEDCPMSGPSIVGIDLGWIDPTAILIGTLAMGKLFITDEIVVEETRLNILCEEIKQRTKGIMYVACDSAGKKVDQTSGVAPVAEIQKRLGAHVFTNKRQKLEMLNIAQSALDQSKIKVSPSCEKLIQVFYNYEFKTEGAFKHDQYSHVHDAFVYLALAFSMRGIAPRNSISIIDRSDLGLI